MIGRTNVGGGAGLNFKVVGNPQPSNPVENTIWVDTDTPITSWVFSATEPGSSDVMALSIISGSPWYLSAPQSLSAGDVLSFEIPGNVSNTYEAINIADPTTGDEYFVRNSDGSACNAWVKGTKVSVVLSNDTNQLNGYGGNAKTAYIRSYGSYGMTEGMVWIATGTTGTIEFNALKKNDITIQILSASQYVSGAWVSKTAKIYQNSAWVGFELYLYNAGNTFADITGGWVGYAKGQTSSSGNATKPTAKYNTDNVVITCSDDSGWASGMWCAKNKIALTERSKLVFDGLLNAKIAYLTVWSAIGEYTKDNLVAETQITKTSRSTVELDVSSLSGSYYIGLRFQGSQTEPQVTMFSLKAK